MFKNIDVSVEGAIAWIRLVDEKSLNAFSAGTLQELRERILEVERKSDIHVVVLTGAGKSFVAGADIKEMQNMTPREAFAYASDTCDIYSIIERSDKCYIAMINGYAFGAGFELSLACDIRIASDNASFMLPEVSLGIIPGGGGTQKLARFIGEGRAKELIFLNKRLNAEKALEYGLIADAVPCGMLAERTKELALKVLKNSATGIAMAKRAFNYGRNTGLEEGMIFERQAFALCFSETDQRERMTAFVNKNR